MERRPGDGAGIARDGLDRLVDMDDAIILGQLAIPAARAAADLAVRAGPGETRRARPTRSRRPATWSSGTVPPPLG